MPPGTKKRAPDYEGLENQAWKEAADEVREEAGSYAEAGGPSRLNKRIETYCERFGYDPEVVRHKIRTDPMFACWFAKEPRRTGMHEKLAAEFIRREISGIRDFEVLPKAGKNALKVSSDGNVEPENGGRTLEGKSLDFRWKVGETTVFASHKYTKEGGGNQDSQFKELLGLMTRFQRCTAKECALIVIADGPYYLAGRNPRLEQLRALEKDRVPRSFAIQIEDLQRVIDALRSS